MSRLLTALLYLGAADALHYLEGATATTEEVFANGTYSYAPQQYILYGIEYDHSAGFSGGNLTYGNISGPVLLLKREEICDMRPNFKYEDKVVAVNLPDMDILSSWTGQSESSRILFVLLDNPNLGVPPLGVSNIDAAAMLHALWES